MSVSSELDLLADGSLPARWLRMWSSRPPWPQLRDIDDRWLSSDEVEARSRSVALGLLSAGLVTGDRFVVCAPSSASLVVFYVGALRAGLVVVPLNTAYTEAEVARLVVDARPAGAFVADESRASWIREAGGASVRLFGNEGGVSARADGPIDSVGVDDPALLIYTSGTTGRPKGARLTHGNLLASATAVGEAWAWTPDDRLLLTLPLFHVHGLGVGLNGALCAGASVELRPAFALEDVLTRSSSGDLSMFFGVPTIYSRIASAGRARDLRPLRLIVSGSAPLPPSVASAIAEGAGQLPLERYGMTETIMLTTNPLDGERRPGTVGFPFPGVSLRLADSGSGEIQVRGPNVISEYYERPEATAETFTSDGWFRTGDLGSFDDAGYLKIVGRSKELIISGGFNVYPREVEERLLEFPGVAEVAVIGRPDPDWGEAVTAVVVASAPIDVEALRSHAAAGLAPYKVPKRIEFTDALPRNALGKVVRSRL
ncbi:MAG: AMP-binding protein [Solirubrobacteraceae bacterium]